MTAKQGLDLSTPSRNTIKGSRPSAARISNRSASRSRGASSSASATQAGRITSLPLKLVGIGRTDLFILLAKLRIELRSRLRSLKGIHHKMSQRGTFYAFRLLVQIAKQQLEREQILK